ncbi:hypothetical protein ZWY2020_057624 [Hordeum vulgare]|nr:hypothetical protein ZWY2020_057624 [Hordeum vulgare]
MPLRVYVGMLARGARPDAYTFPPLLKAMAAERGAVPPSVGHSVHAHVVKFGLELNAHVASSLVLMYAARGDGMTARALLDVQPARGGGTPVVWNALMSGHKRSRQFRLSCCSFLDMARAGVVATPVTYITVLSACGKGNDVLLGMQLHKRIIESGCCLTSRIQHDNKDSENLRMCLDCHNAIKLITNLYMREVVVRDRTRFHHFRHGLCSCKEYCLAQLLLKERKFQWGNSFSNNT